MCSWKIGTFERTCERKPHEQVVGRIVGANNVGMLEEWKRGNKGSKGNRGNLEL